jgi:broad specificity phosphatase PhoE
MRFSPHLKRLLQLKLFVIIISEVSSLRIQLEPSFGSQMASSVVPPSSDGRRQYICLVRHGQSRAQGTNKKERRSNTLLDCHCSSKGISQAYSLPERLTAHGGVSGVELVVSSPLTRALTTALLGFRDRPEHVPIVVHPACRETGSEIPENQARSVAALERDKDLSSLPRFDDLDFGLLPSYWPNDKDSVSPRSANGAADGGGGGRYHTRSKGPGKGKSVLSKPKGGSSQLDRSNGLFDWLRARPESRIVVVCHHNYISSLLGFGALRVENAIPIECILDDQGITLATEVEATETGSTSDRNGSGTQAAASEL